MSAKDGIWITLVLGRGVKTMANPLIIGLWFFSSIGHPHIARRPDPEKCFRLMLKNGGDRNYVRAPHSQWELGVVRASTHCLPISSI